ncbi:citrate lyase, alpha subunit [Treponema primitia ZAS-2]|uniref:Citrate lyase alpha chain n=1 Tax=Treponema primitia (strain ATCC BAA-887 / DSM 12427 / ZAS-2) TaxID=545694 RepID=F5YKA0_TREPZ|nr:citrate lyase subunit alpha [Treponema primitia]AEF84684.1 citrate lyase, alpha subunit [Treponema primitia ZAS-2]
MSEFNYDTIPYIGEIGALHGKFDPAGAVKDHKNLAERQKLNNKIVESLEKAIELSGLKNGMTISFHHHFRDGDYIVNLTLDKLAEMGFRDLIVAASSLSDCHAPMIKHIKSGLVQRIETSGLRGELAEAVSRGLMDAPVTFRSHGGRAYAIETRELHIDVAFLGAPSCDPYGNANGYIRGVDQGIMCGSLGYAKTDAQYADKTIVITNHIVPYPNIPFGIPESDVNYVVVVDEIGDPEGIMKGATRFTKSPMELLMATTCADVIEATGRFTEGFSMQMGSGGASLAVVRFLRERMIRQKISASFALGGITGQIVEMHEEGLIKKILDVQSFDLTAAQSLKNNRFHSQISASYYASPSNKGTAVNQLDIVVLSALEVDINYNVNVLTGADGVIRGAIGGHPDTAQGASVSIIILPLTRSRIPCVVDRVNTVVTPGETVDVIVTNHGVTVNPRRPLLAEKIRKYGIPLCSIEDLRDKARKIVGDPDPVEYTDKIVGIVAYRDNTVIDVIRQVKE